MAFMQSVGSAVGKGVAYVVEGSQLGASEFTQGYKQGYAEKAEQLRQARLASMARMQAPAVPAPPVVPAKPVRVAKVRG